MQQSPNPNEYPQQPYPQPQGYPQQQPYPGQMPPQQPMYQPQPPKKKSGGKKFLIGCGSALILVIVIIAIAVAASSQGGSNASGNSNPNTSSSNTSNPTSAPATWKTTHTYSGSGIKKTGTITVGNDWKINWKCDPKSFYGNTYNVQIAVFGSDGSLQDMAINDICKSGNTSGSTEEHSGGDIYLDINSEGAWTITVQELQ